MRSGAVGAPLYQQPSALLIRVLDDGFWGYASTSSLTPGDIVEAVRAAAAIARSGRLLPSATNTTLLSVPPSQSTPGSPPASSVDVPLADKRDLLLALHKDLSLDRKICSTFARIDAVHRVETFASTEGAELSGHEVITGLHYHVEACEGELKQRRSSPFHFARAGWDFITGLTLSKAAQNLADEALHLLDAEPCPEGEIDLILAPSTLAILLYETLGAPLELDRILTGQSYIAPSDKGERILGSPALTLAANPSASHRGLGTWRFDDEGVAADDTDLIIDGRVVRFLSDRGHALRVEGDQPAGALRGSGLNEQPLLRCPALEMRPGRQSLASLQGDVASGFLLEGARSWEMDPKRKHFRLRAERAVFIQDGVPGAVYRDPVIDGQTLDFWPRLDEASTAREAVTLPWTVKGMPQQTAGVTIEAPWARFRGVYLAS